MKGWVFLAAAIVIGVVNAIVFEVFELVVNNGQQLIWNDWLNTNTSRWLVVPVAVVLSILFSLILRWLKESRWTDPGVSLDLTSADGHASLKAITKILVTGASGLLAGASLGPEMPLTESAGAIGRYTNSKFGVKNHASSLLVAASVGAVLVAFLNSMLMVLLPILMVYKKAKKITFGAAAFIFLTGLSSYVALSFIKHSDTAIIPALPPARVEHYVGVIVVSLLVSIAALFLMRTIMSLSCLTKIVHTAMPWYLSAGSFGVVLGGLYLLGGEPVQFSGLEGIKLLLANPTHYGTWALLGMVIIKLIATAWSKTTGYRGGMYLPSIFVGVALSLLVGSVFSTLGGTATMIGSIAAIFMALSIKDEPDITHKDYFFAAVLGLLFMAALLPIGLLPLTTVAIITAALGNKTLVRLLPKH